MATGKDEFEISSSISESETEIMERASDQITSILSPGSRSWALRNPGRRVNTTLPPAGIFSEYPFQLSLSIKYQLDIFL
ncbi:hypothetical protein AKJ51_01755 [candidate division MSBL1 archaeon SCGC-AAA382A20]|uniref:Uncharacterized protein n=1 Tax=candidate division MSBL1 archaeon SCGC-AAA382A20 TaxID=1698280 RepID=A0A133VLF8_9EURY|nr:hypothetical protein AKJ51_01755 [candidate division MSBL1 archaeon SCGC-AAA382A20]